MLFYQVDLLFDFSFSDCGSVKLEQVQHKQKKITDIRILEGPKH